MAGLDMVRASPPPHFVRTELVLPRPAPRQAGAPLWRRLVGRPAAAVLTLALLAVLLPLAWWVGQWGVAQAVWRPDVDACQAVRGTGACWGVVAEKGRFILFGRYPYEAQWRPLTGSLVLLALVGLSAWRGAWRWPLLPAWGAGLALFFVLMGGGVAGLSPVPTDLWGGLPLTLLLTTLGVVLAFPLALALALGRRSDMPALRTICVLYIELVRGLPLVSVLFMASFLFPLFMPLGQSPDVLVRVVAGISLFAAAYLAETVRGGLQAIPRGQWEAAHAIGLGWWQTQRKVVLPQALAIVVPGIMNSFISLFKDTSLVTIVSLYELTGALGLALNSDAAWRPFMLEGYLFIAAIYFVFCAAMSRYSLWLEQGVARVRR